jgi:hypothetical protein
VHLLTRELLLWVAARPRTYAETMEAWRSNCPRHSTWEDACIDGLVEVVESEVKLTAQGRAAIQIPS